MTTTQNIARVVAVATAVRRLNRNELAQLVALVPALREVQPFDEDHVVARFRQLGLELRAGRPASLDDPFLGGLTYAQYFALSTAEQDAFWEQLFHEPPLDMEAMPEVDLTADAKLSAG
jgi:glucan biosynthesis protein